MSGAFLHASHGPAGDLFSVALEREVADLASKGTALRMHWIDIEDEVELVGDVDVETFPTIVIADHDKVRFCRSADSTS